MKERAADEANASGKAGEARREKHPGRRRKPKENGIGMAIEAPGGKSFPGWLSTEERNFSMKNQIQCLLLAVCLLVGAAAVPVQGAVPAASAWAQPAMQEAEQRGWLTESLKARARQPMTRQELCSLAVAYYKEATGNSGVTMQTYPFTDTKSKDVAFAVANGILEPLSTHIFGAQGYVTREEMAGSLETLANLCGVHLRDAQKLTARYRDAEQVSPDYQAAVKIMADAGIMQGYDGWLYPRSQVTVEQAVSMLLTAGKVFAPQTVQVGAVELRLGETAAELAQKLGKPQSGGLDEYGAGQQVFALSGGGTVIAGLQGGRVVSLFVRAESLGFAGLTGASRPQEAKTLQFDKETPQVGRSSRYEAEALVLFDILGDGTLECVYLCDPILRAGGVTQAGAVGKTLLGWVNALRQGRGLTTLAWDNTAASCAAGHCSELAFAQNASYVNKLGESPFQRMDNFGIDYVLAAENISVSQSSSIEIFCEWMGNAGARGNLLEMGLNRTGVGTYVRNGKLFVTMDLYEARQ